MADALGRPKLILLCASAFGALGTSQAFAQQPGEISAPALPPALETAIAQSHEALRRNSQWRSFGLRSLICRSRRHHSGQPVPVHFGKGQAEVLKALNNAATKYKDGTVVAVDRVATLWR